jgi:acyl-CoA synthetase (AMP-forming)/AMP-acid ligase II
MLSITKILSRAARMSPNSAALRFENRTLTWSEYEQRCTKLGGALADLGIAAGDRVAVISKNTDKLAELFFGPSYIGAVYAPINFRWAIPEMIACVEDCTPKVLIADKDHVEQARAMKSACPSIATLIYADEGNTPVGFLNYDTWLAAATPATDGGFGGNDLAALYFTAGTTARAKGVMVSHQSIYVAALAQTNVTSKCQDPCFMMVMPIFHVAGAMRLYGMAMQVIPMVFLRQFDVQLMMQTISDHKVTHFLAAPSMLNFMLNDAKFSTYDFSSLHQIVYGASPITESLLRKILVEFPHVLLTQGYGMTEALPAVTCLENDAHDPDGPLADKLTSVGRPMLPVEVKIVDNAGNELSTGAIGEIVVRSPCMMQGYWQQPELTAEVLKDGWYSSGDGGYLDQDGYLFLVDRVKDMIVSGGENVYSLEVESVIYQHPAILECAVIGIPSDTWGEAVHAIITLKQDNKVKEQELISFCREQIAGYKCPRSIEIRTEPMPMSGVNKILKKELRAVYWP